MATKEPAKESAPSKPNEADVKAGSFNRSSAETSADETWALLREITRGQNETVAALTNLIKTMTTMPKSSTDGGSMDKKADQAGNTAAPGAANTADPQQESKTVQDLRKALQLVIDHALETDQTMTPDEYKKAIDKLTEVITKDPSKAASAVEQDSAEEEAEADAEMDAENQGYDDEGNVRSSRIVPFINQLNENQSMLLRNKGDVFESALEIVPFEMKRSMYPPGYFDNHGYQDDQWGSYPEFDEWYDDNVESPPRESDNRPKYNNPGNNHADRRGALSNNHPGRNGPSSSNHQPTNGNGNPRNQANEANRGGALNRNRAGPNAPNNPNQHANHGNAPNNNSMRGQRGGPNGPNRLNPSNNGSNQGHPNYPDRSMSRTPNFGNGNYGPNGNYGQNGQYGNLHPNQYGPMVNNGRNNPGYGPGNNMMPNQPYGHHPNYGMYGQGMGYGNQYPPGPGYGNMPNYPANWANQSSGHRGSSDGTNRNRTVDQYGRHHDQQGKYSVESKKRAPVGDGAKSVVLSSKVSAAKRLQAIAAATETKKRTTEEEDHSVAASKKKLSPNKDTTYEPLMTRILASAVNPDKRPAFMGHNVGRSNTAQARRNLIDFYSSHHDDYMNSLKHPNIVQQRLTNSYPKDASPDVIEAIDMQRERNIEEMFTEIYSSLISSRKWGGVQNIGFVIPANADIDEKTMGFQIMPYTKLGGDSIRKRQNQQDVTHEHVQSALKDYINRGSRTSVVGKYMSVKAQKLAESSSNM